ncbi:MAG: hypothetical protein ACREMV_12695, partial [Gemmatimonadales bacterium]
VLTGWLPRRTLSVAPQPAAAAISDALLWRRLGRDELRLDVDGTYPRMVASGTLARGLATRVHWIADLTAAGPDRWSGDIWYKDGAVAAFPSTHVEIQVLRDRVGDRPHAVVAFSGGGAPERALAFTHRTRSFHPVEFEFDSAEGTTAITSIDTHAHPNRPAGLPAETLTVEAVFRRAGLAVTRSAGGAVVPLSGAGPNAKWSDAEMHDAMQAYWSRFADRAQWALWVFFAALHEQGSSLGGIMFDDIGPNHRQGSALFTTSFIAQPPAGDPAPDAWVRRMIFWTACHEMGHAFNLAHSWQKALGTPWIALANEPEARSFMNYPFLVAGGQTSFFADFQYRFSDAELLFMRHAPARFVQMGNADWFDHHALEQANVSPEPALRLTLRVNRDRPVFEFLEPVVVELKLTNINSEPQLVDERLLAMADRMTVIIKPRGKPARQFIPYAQYCWESRRRVLTQGDSIYESFFLSAGRNGWDLAEPGDYTIQAVLHRDDEGILSAPLTIRILPPRGYEEELLAQDFFTDEIGRILTFDGSRVLRGGTDTLRSVTERLGERRVAAHARVALAAALAREFKLLRMPGERGDMTSARAAGGVLEIAKAEPDAARKEFAAALAGQPPVAAETLGHVDYKYYMDHFCAWLADQGEPAEAAEVQDTLLQTLAARGVLERVLEDIRRRRDTYRTASTGSKGGKGGRK